MRLLLLLLLGLLSCVSAIIHRAQHGTKLNNDACGGARCGPGFECRRSLSNFEGSGGVSCQCARSCPRSTLPRRVCGSDRRTYPSLCELRRRACITGNLNSTEPVAKGRCPHKPLVCLSRDLETLIKRVSVHLHGTTEEELSVCTAESGTRMDVARFLSCLQHAELISSGNSRDTVCIDSLFALADRDKDGELSHAEFKAILEPSFYLPPKSCFWGGKDFVDGSERFMDCNICVCASARWQCSSATCSGDLRELEAWDRRRTAGVGIKHPPAPPKHHKPPSPKKHRHLKPIKLNEWDDEP